MAEEHHVSGRVGLDDRRVYARAPGGFVGRATEFASVHDRLLADDRSRRGVLVEGEAGIGKTRLIVEVVTHLPSSTRVARGRGDPLQRDRPFGAVATAITALRDDDDVPGALHELSDVDVSHGPPIDHVGPGRHAHLVDVLAGTIHQASRAAPIVLVLDDLQWVDAGSLAVVHELLTSGSNVAFVGAARGEPRPAHLDQLVASLVPRHLQTMVLPRLADQDVEELVRRMVGDRPGPLLASHVAGASGNPLFVTELIDALSEDHALVRAVEGNARQVELAEASVPPSLRMTLLRRLSTLPPDALDMLLAAATLGATFDLADLALVLGEPATVVAARLREPMRAGWIEASGEHLAFRHDLVRDAVYDDAVPAVRRALHRQVADQLLAAGRPAGVVARHLVLGSVAPDPRAARWLSAEGRDALASAPDVAADLLGAAAELDPAPGAWRDEVVLDLGVASMWAGEVERGEAVLRGLLDGPHTPTIDADARLALARSCVLAGRTTEALELLHDTSRDPDGGCDERPHAGEHEDGTGETPVARTRLAVERALTHMLRGELDDARRESDAVLAVADTHGTDETRCLATGVRSALLAMRGRFDDAVLAAEQAVAIASASTHRETARRPPQLFLGSILIDSDRFDAGWRALHDARRTSEQLGNVWDLPVQHLVSARGRFLAGQHDDVVAEVQTAFDVASDSGTHVLEVWGHAMLAHVHLHRGDTAAARRSLVAGETAMTVTGPQVRGTDWLLWARALLDDVEGRHDEARSLLAVVWDAHRSLGLHSESRLLGPDLLRLHLRTGARDDAAAVVAAVEDNAEVAGTASARAAALRCRGLLDDDADRLVAAVTAIAATRCRMEHALTALDAGAALARAGRDEPAVESYTAARELGVAAGMLAAVRQAEAGLRVLGVRYGVRGERGERPVTGWDALTPTELIVTRLAAQGLTNPEIGERLFVSRRTVQTHLSHVFAKLGVTSRVELATLAIHHVES